MSNVYIRIVEDNKVQCFSIKIFLFSRQHVNRLDDCNMYAVLCKNHYMLQVLIKYNKNNENLTLF